MPLLGADADLYARSGGDPLEEGQTARLRQAGGLECLWFGAADGLGDNFAIGFAILAEVSNEIAEYALPPDPNADVLLDSFGAGSLIACVEGEVAEVSQCTFSALVAENYWIDGYLNVPAAVGGIAGVSTFLSDLGSRLDSAEPVTAPVYEVPTEAFGVGLDCETIMSSAAFKQNQAFATLADAQDSEQHSLGIFSAVSHRIGASTCTWPQPDQATLDIHGGERIDPLSITVTPGGEWNWDALSEDALAVSGTSTYSSLDLAGATEALIRAGSSGCALLALVEHSVVTIETRVTVPNTEPCTTAKDAFAIVRDAAAN